MTNSTQKCYYLYATVIPFFICVMRKEISIDHLGNEYGSQKEMCEAYGISQSLFCKRIERDWSVKEALLGKVLITRNGKDYFTQKEIAEDFDIHPNTIRKKLAQGYTYDEIIDKKVYRVSDPWGNRYKTTEDMCKTHGLKVSTYRGRVNNGKTQEEALTESVRKKNPRVR